jgi:hypothetical protein
MNRVILVALTVAFGVAVLPGGSRAAKWPRIKPFTAEYHFTSAEKAELRKLISGASGRPLYVLECYAFAVNPGIVFNYSGDFECVLHFPEPPRVGYSTLLTELPYADADWESRGRFLDDQLVEPCGDYLNLGRKREFELRGFKLTLDLDHIVFDRDKLSIWSDAPAMKSFDMEVSVAPDPAANSDIAATPDLPPLRSVPKKCRSGFGDLYLQQFRAPERYY